MELYFIDEDGDENHISDNDDLEAAILTSCGGMFSHSSGFLPALSLCSILLLKRHGIHYNQTKKFCA